MKIALQDPIRKSNYFVENFFSSSNLAILVEIEYGYLKGYEFTAA